MYFKDWCLEHYKITSFSETKILDRIFLPAIPQNRPILDALMLKFGGYITTHNQINGLTFTKKQYDRLLQVLQARFCERNLAGYDAQQITDNATRYFCRLGFDTKAVMQYRTPPGIYLRLDGTQATYAFMTHFSKFKPKLSYDFLNNAYVIEMPANFLNFLYDFFYSNMMVSINDLPYIKQRETRLQQLLVQIHRKGLTKKLDVHQKLALDYDNDVTTTPEACTSYAMSLKIYAELHRDGLSAIDYSSFYAASTLLAAYDRHGQLKQSLKSDALFVDYIRKDLYLDYSKSIRRHKTIAHPLIDDLPQDKKELILKEIDVHTDHILYGHCKTRLDKNNYIRTRRFIPDKKFHSDTDEIIIRSGGQLGHSANVRIIKVAIFQSPEDQAINNPHHYDYFKVENNLGVNSHQPDCKTKTCLGTFVTKITPCVRKKNNSFNLLPIDPWTHPDDYQTAMENTLNALIKVERLLLFYRAAQPGREGTEWLRLNKLNLLLSGQPYDQPVHYRAQDALNPSVKYDCTVYNQSGYLQEGGSCPVFSIKSLVTSVIGQELSALHNHFMQQHDAFGYISALQMKIMYYTDAITRLSPVVITENSNDIQIKVNKFKQMLGVNDTPLPGLTVLDTTNPDESTVVLYNPWLIKLWNRFVSPEANYQYKPPSQLINPNQFFNQQQLLNTSPETGRHEYYKPGM